VSKFWSDVHTVQAELATLLCSSVNVYVLHLIPPKFSFFFELYVRRARVPIRVGIVQSIQSWDGLPRNLCSRLSRDRKQLNKRDTTPCSPSKVNRRFGGTSLPFAGQKKKPSKYCHLFSHGGFLGLFFRPWRWRRCTPSKRRFTFNGLHGIVSHKIVLFINTAVRTSNPK
jgi:hypothetical protein